MALVEAKQDDKYKAIIGDAVEFLKKLQWDEDEGKTAKDDFFGGAGYDSKSRPDLSNTQMFLDALKAAGIGPDDPAMKKALIFVNRCQNLKGESNDHPGPSSSTTAASSTPRATAAPPRSSISRSTTAPCPATAA